jgi:hypothetical protein
MLPQNCFVVADGEDLQPVAFVISNPTAARAGHLLRGQPFTIRASPSDLRAATLALAVEWDDAAPVLIAIPVSVSEGIIVRDGVHVLPLSLPQSAAPAAVLSPRGGVASPVTSASVRIMTRLFASRVSTSAAVTALLSWRPGTDPLSALQRAVFATVPEMQQVSESGLCPLWRGSDARLDSMWFRAWSKYVVCSAACRETLKSADWP